MNKEKVSIPNEEKERWISKTTGTAFILMFPAFILGIIATSSSEGFMPLIAIALSVYQFLLIKKFIEDYYKK